MKTTFSTLIFTVLFGMTSKAQTQTPPFTVTYNAYNPICYDESNGLIDIYVDGTTGPYAYMWNDGSTGSFKAELPAGVYQVSITDINNTTVDLSIELTDPSPLLVTGNITSVSSSGGNTGAIDVSVSIPEGTFNYEWTTLSGSGINTSGIDQNSLTVGTYVLTVMNEIGCIVSRTFEITQSYPSVAPFEAQTNSFVTQGSGATQSAVVFPNPSIGKVNFKSDEKVKSIAIYDMNGFLVENIQNTEKNTPSVDLKSGNYTAVITLATGVTTNEHIVVR